MQFLVGMPGTDLARRKPGVQIPSPPPPNPAGQSVASMKRAALAACWGRAGAANAHGRVFDVALGAAAEAVDRQTNPSLTGGQRPALLAAHGPCEGSNSSRPWERRSSARRSSSRVRNPNSEEAVSLSGKAPGPAALKRWVTQPPGKVYERVRAVPSMRRQRRAPACSEVTSVAPARSQEAVSLTTIAPLPARSWSRVITERPLLTATSATVQSAGTNCRHGISEADGTDWAISHNCSRSLQPTSLTPSEVATASSLSKMILVFRAARPAGPRSPPRVRSGGRSSAGPGSAEAGSAAAARTRHAGHGPGPAADGAAGRAGPGR